MSHPVRVAHITSVDSTLWVLLLAQLRRLRDEGFEVTTISAPGPWASRLADHGIRHIPWRHATRAWNPRSDVRAFFELLRILRRERFDIVHTHNPKPGVLGRVAAGLVGVPCVAHTVHGLYATQQDPLARRLPVLAIEWFAARFSDVELFQSEEDLTWARRIRMVGVSKSVLLGNGTDLSRFDPAAVPPERATEVRRGLGIPQDALMVGTVGRLVAEKGYRELFAAARRVREAVPSARFVAIGERDPDKADAITDEEIASAKDDVIFLGWRDDIPDVLASMDVFVLPSWREGVPRSAIEAAAMGKPMVLTDIRGCREVGRDGREGILVPPRDPERLAAGIILLLRDPLLRERLGAAARERALSRFDGRSVEEVLLTRYRDLLVRKGRPSRRIRHSAAELRGGHGTVTGGAMTGRREIEQRSPVGTPMQRAAKRSFDVIVSSACLVVASPLFAAISGLVRLTMGPPILFRQVRLGLAGCPFVLYKVRTMTQDRDARGELLPDEQRLTNLGRFLRRSTLDELPELINVLRGDMSIVGPRPLLPEYRDLYTPEQWRRHELKPGMAGPVPAMGRNALSWEEKLALDIWYVDSWSFWLDLRLLLISFWKVLKAEGISAEGHATMPRLGGTRTHKGTERRQER
ncbi:MAG: sugar transferase [Actinomycetota bacterium]